MSEFNDSLVVNAGFSTEYENYTEKDARKVMNLLDENLSGEEKIMQHYGFGCRFESLGKTDIAERFYMHSIITCLQSLSIIEEDAYAEDFKKILKTYLNMMHNYSGPEKVIRFCFFISERLDELEKNYPDAFTFRELNIFALDEGMAYCESIGFSDYVFRFEDRKLRKTGYYN